LTNLFTIFLEQWGSLSCTGTIQNEISLVILLFG